MPRATWLRSWARRNVKMKAVVDNDILFKGACHGFLSDIAAALKVNDSDCGVLGSARFVLKSKIKRARLRQNAEVATQGLEAFLANAPVLEPVREEQAIAARLEALALRLGLSLDAGETQLCAIVIVRAISLLVTGDKRAVASMERLVEEDDAFQDLSRRVMCLEQLILLLLVRKTLQSLRTAICSEPGVDKTLTICFACYSSEVSESAVKDGLKSYIDDLRSRANEVLVA